MMYDAIAYVDTDSSVGGNVLFGMSEIHRQDQVNDQSYAPRREAAEDLNSWIGTWYNQKRLHSSLGHVPPIEYERSKKCA